jgi:hypothetical protein
MAVSGAHAIHAGPSWARATGEHKAFLGGD